MTQSAKRFAHVEHGIDREPYHYKACGLDDVYLRMAMPSWKPVMARACK